MFASVGYCLCLFLEFLVLCVCVWFVHMFLVFFFKYTYLFLIFETNNEWKVLKLACFINIRLFYWNVMQNIYQNMNTWLCLLYVLFVMKKRKKIVLLFACGNKNARFDNNIQIFWHFHCNICSGMILGFQKNPKSLKMVKV